MTLRPVGLVVRPLQTLPAAKRRVQARREASNPVVPPREQDQQGRESAGRAREGAGKREGSRGQGRAWEQAAGSRDCNPRRATDGWGWGWWGELRGHRWKMKGGMFDTDVTRVWLRVEGTRIGGGEVREEEAKGFRRIVMATGQDPALGRLTEEGQIAKGPGKSRRRSGRPGFLVCAAKGLTESGREFDLRFTF